MARSAKNKTTTIVDIAHDLGLSAMTVSRALTGNPEVSQKTRAKVIERARVLGYQPNRWARSLVTRKSHMIGVVIPDIAHSFFPEIIGGIEEVLEKEGYDILLCHSRGNPDRERAEIEALIGTRVDGLIVATVQPEKSPGPFAERQMLDVPFVLVDRYFPRYDFYSVCVNDRAAGRMATAFLIQLGHRRVAHIAGPALSTGSLRRRGFLDAMRKAGIDHGADRIAMGNFDIEGGRQAMRQLLELPEPPTAVFAANDPMAIGAIYACRDAGLRVPEDISIVGAGNIEGIHHPNPFLTTIDWPRPEVGRVAATLLLDAIARGDEAKPEARVFPPNLLVRQSTAPPA